MFSITLIAIVLLIFAGLQTAGTAAFFSAHTGPGSFYTIVPYGAMLAVFGAAGLFALVSLWLGVCALWKLTEGKRQWLDFAAHKKSCP